MFSLCTFLQLSVCFREDGRRRETNSVNETERKQTVEANVFCIEKEALMEALSKSRPLNTLSHSASSLPDGPWPSQPYIHLLAGPTSYHRGGLLAGNAPLYRGYKATLNCHIVSGCECNSSSSNTGVSCSAGLHSLIDIEVCHNTYVFLMLPVCCHPNWGLKKPEVYLDKCLNILY